MKVVKGIVNTLINILIVVVLVVSLLVAAMALTSKSSGISTIFGYTVQVVVSDSMAGGSDEYEGGNFEKGDVIIGKATKFDSTLTFKEGDIVTYKGFLQGNDHLGEQLICHRIIDVAEIDGVAVYQTQGDNRTVSQVPDQSRVDAYISSASIGAVFYSDDYHGITIKGLGNFYEFITGQLGFFLCILLPMIIFFLYVLIKVVINAVEYRKSKEEENKEDEFAARLKELGIDPDSVKKEESDDSDTTSQDTPANPAMTAEEYEQFKQFMAFKEMQKNAEAQASNTEDTADDADYSSEQA